jgi:hypothetical protein
MDVVLRYIGDSWRFGDISPLRMVCREWRSILDGTGMYSAVKSNLDDMVRVYMCCMHRSVSGIIGLFHYPTVDAHRWWRMTMMYETLKHADAVISKMWPPRLGNRISEVCLMTRLVRQLRGTEDLLYSIGAGKVPITVNFDQAEMGITRRMGELESAQPEASDCISDPWMRQRWRASFSGTLENDSEVTWESFSRLFLRGDVPEGDGMVHHLRTFLCFPEGRTVTPYAIHLLARLYGPGPDVWTNFRRLMMGRGFVGIVNMVHAEEIFESASRELRDRCFMLRYSRMHPDVLTISTYEPNIKRFTHRRNSNPTLTLPELMDRMSEDGWRLAPFAMDGTLSTGSALDISRSDRCTYRMV